jgi:1-acyl-sn-glycerol-3-phosphate acyltransferase
LPDQVDYLNKKLKSKIATKIANAIGDGYFKKLLKKGAFVIEETEGKEYLSALQGGAIVTCNHFSMFDNYVIYNEIRSYLPKKYLYKVIREGNYTGFKGLYGFLFRHCNTLPLSSKPRTMINFLSAVNTLLLRGETILIYPEQGMWWNYRKVRPFKLGGFKMAYRAGKPVLPMFITMTDDEKSDGDGYPVQRHKLHIMPPIYPDTTLGEKAGVEKMRDEAFAACKAKYEEVYKIPLAYIGDEQGERGEAKESGEKKEENS